MIFCFLTNQAESTQMKYYFSQVLLLMFFFSSCFSPVLWKLPVLLEKNNLLFKLISEHLLEESNSLSTRKEPWPWTQGQSCILTWQKLTNSVEYLAEEWEK